MTLKDNPLPKNRHNKAATQRGFNQWTIGEAAPSDPLS
jgi:hypothetical protein